VRTRSSSEVWADANGAKAIDAETSSSVLKPCFMLIPLNVIYSYIFGYYLGFCTEAPLAIGATTKV